MFVFLFKLLVHNCLQIDFPVQQDSSCFRSNWSFLFKKDCSKVCLNLLLISMFKFKDYISIQIICWYFCSNWLLTFLFKIECWYFCSIGLLLFLFKTDCWFFCSNWLLLFVLLFTFDIFVAIDCWYFCSKWYFCSNWLFINLFKLIVHFSNQIDWSIFCSKCLFMFLFKLIVRFLFKIGCWFFCSNWLLIYLFKLVVYFF